MAADKGNKTYFAVSTEAFGIPGDCMVYDSEKEARRDAPTDLEIGDAGALYLARIVVGPRTKLVMEAKVVKRLIEIPLTEDEERG